MRDPEILQFFKYEHLPEFLQEVSKPFKDLVATLITTLPDSQEREFALRKLLEAKDCAVRARLIKKEKYECKVNAL